jgi:CHAT domain-containing protein/tetratricopeptide (TPR) repeat protein
MVQETEGPIEEAIAKLTAAAVKTPLDAGIWSDLAAAHLARAARRDDPLELMPALAAANRAVAADGSRIEARFNRALVLEKLFLGSDAREAWQDYLRLDARSPWASEARLHLAALDRPLPDLKTERLRLEQAIATGHKEVVRQIVERYPQGMREHAEGLLFDWAEARLHGDEKAAARHLDIARGIGAALAESEGEEMVGAAVAAIDRARAAHDEARLALLAAGHRAFHKGYALYKESRPRRALARLTAARRSLEAAGSPFGEQAAFFSACAEHHLNRYARSFAGLDKLEKGLAGQPYPTLLGHVAWMKGVSQLVRGNPLSALGFHTSALPYFERTHEVENVAALHSLIADSLEFLGRNRDSWRHRYLALRARSMDPRRGVLIFQGLADSAMRQGEAAIAFSFQSEAVRNAERTKNAALLADALFGRASISNQIGDSHRAIGDLEEARRVIGPSEDRAVRRRIQAGIALVEGESEITSDPRRAIAHLTAALRFYEATGHHFHSLTAHGARARAYRRIGDSARAEADLRAGIRAYQHQGEGLVQEDLRLAFLEQTWSLFDDMIAFQVEERRSPERAFAYADRSLTQVLPGLTSQLQIRRDARQNLIVEEPEPETLREVQHRLPAGTALVQYSVQKDRLLIWLIQPRQSSFYERPISEEELRKLVTRVRGIEKSGWASASAELYEMLIRPWHARVGEGESIVFVPDKVLQGVPFACLRGTAGGPYLLEEHRLAIAPSATLYLNALRHDYGAAARRPDLDTLVVGNPAFDRGQFSQLRSLDSAGVEATHIAALYPGALLLKEKEADRESFLRLAPRSWMIHFAGHAVVNEKNPLLSMLVFAPGKDGDPGALYAHEIYQLHLQSTRLVVLAACDTAGDAPVSEGGASLARAFLAAGVPAVVASLWGVGDGPTALLFEAFHRRLRAGADPVTALRDAQLTLLRNRGPESSPAAWGAFEVIGASVH